MGTPIIDSVTSVIPRFDASLNLLLHVSFGTELGYSVEPFARNLKDAWFWDSVRGHGYKV